MGFAVFAGIVTLILSIGSIVVTLRTEYMGKEDKEFPRLLYELSKKKEQGEEITQEDIDEMMRHLSIAQYAKSPQDRRLLVTGLIEAAGESHRRRTTQPATVYVNVPPGTQSSSSRTHATP